MPFEIVRNDITNMHVDAIVLELDLEQTKDLICRAGYALTNSSKFDIIIRFFIESGNYNMMDTNITLFMFDQTLLESQAN